MHIVHYSRVSETGMNTGSCTDKAYINGGDLSRYLSSLYRENRTDYIGKREIGGNGHEYRVCDGEI